MGGGSSKENEDQVKLDQYLQSAEYQQKLNAVYSRQQNQQQALHVPQQVDDDDDDYINHGYQGVQINHQPKIANIQSTTLSAQKNDVYINKSSFKFIQIGEATYQLAFQFSCPNQTQIDVWLMGQENQKTGVVTSLYGNIQQQQQMQGFQVQQGQNQEFQSNKVVVDLKLVNVQSLKQYQMKQDEYSFPLIVKISKLNMDHSFTYYCIMEKVSTQLVAHCTLSKLRVQGQEFVTRDVYGMDDSVLGKKNDSEKEPCRICLTNIIDTMIEPCQHVVLCQECCQNLRLTGQRCPICRSEIKEFIIITRGN